MDSIALGQNGYRLLPKQVDAQALQTCLTLVDGHHNTRRLLSKLPQLRLQLDPLFQILDPQFTLCRSLLFDKTPQSNWKVAWHQDLTLSCQQRFELSGWGPWTLKDGLPHVQPPTPILEKMLTMRLHLDPCGADNGPLQVLPGSHSLGRLSHRQILSTRKQISAELCLAEAGDLLLMRPLLVHASSPATQPGHRRIIHLEFCPQNVLPETFLPE